MASFHDFGVELNDNTSIEITADRRSCAKSFNINEAFNTKQQVLGIYSWDWPLELTSSSPCHAMVEDSIADTELTPVINSTIMWLKDLVSEEEDSCRATSDSTGIAQPQGLKVGEEEEQNAEVPIDEEGKETSIGSVGHSTGLCKPCLFVRSKQGCVNMTSCMFCHFPHRRKGKPRTCKGKRDRFRKRIEYIEQRIEADPLLMLHNPNYLEDLVVEIAPSVALNKPLKAKVLAKMGQHAKQVWERICAGGPFEL